MDGQWFGLWAGDWLGSGEPAPPGSISGTAGFSVVATGALTAGESGFTSGAASFNLAASGTLEFTGEPVPAPAVAAPSQSSLGGAEGAGRGQVKTEHGWVRLTSIARVGAEAHTAYPSQAVAAEFGIRRAQSKVQPWTFNVQVASHTSGAQGLLKLYDGTSTTSALVDVDVAATLETIARSCRVDWLGADELLMIIEEMSL